MSLGLSRRPNDDHDSVWVCERTSDWRSSEMSTTDSNFNTHRWFDDDQCIELSAGQMPDWCEDAHLGNQGTEEVLQGIPSRSLDERETQANRVPIWDFLFSLILSRKLLGSAVCQGSTRLATLILPMEVSKTPLLLWCYGQIHHRWRDELCPSLHSAEKRSTLEAQDHWRLSPGWFGLPRSSDAVGIETGRWKQTNYGTRARRQQPHRTSCIDYELSVSSLSQTGINDRGAGYLAEMLNNTYHLTVLRLEDNDIGKEGIEQFTKGLE